MSNNSSTEAQGIEAELRIGTEKIRIEARFSDDPVRLSEMVPLFQDLTEKVVGIGVREAVSRGKTISCHKGCGACCSQLVPVSEPEAIFLLDLLDSLPGERQAEIRRRFAVNVQALQKAGLAEAAITSAIGGGSETRRDIGIQYFEQHLACPFLEGESCSIYPFRPLSCREFMVVSPFQQCARPDPGKVEAVVFPRRVSSLLYSFGDGEGNGERRVVPLVFLMKQAEQLRGNPPVTFRAADIFLNLLERLAE